jgi:hypothetical protein
VTVIMPSMVATVSTSGKCLENYRAASIERSGKARGLKATCRQLLVRIPLVLKPLTDGVGFPY